MSRRAMQVWLWVGLLLALGLFFGALFGLRALAPEWWYLEHGKTTIALIAAALGAAGIVVAWLIGRRG